MAGARKSMRRCLRLIWEATHYYPQIYENNIYYSIVAEVFLGRGLVIRKTPAITTGVFS